MAGISQVLGALWEYKLATALRLQQRGKAHYTINEFGPQQFKCGGFACDRNVSRLNASIPVRVHAWVLVRRRPPTPPSSDTLRGQTLSSCRARLRKFEALQTSAFFFAVRAT